MLGKEMGSQGIGRSGLNGGMKCRNKRNGDGRDGYES